jgi:hypothetical protein
VTYGRVTLDGVGCVYNSWTNPKVVEDVKARCKSRIASLTRAPMGVKQETEYKGVHRNLDKLQSLDGDKPVEIAKPLPKMNDYASAQNKIFAEIYGGCVRPNYVGKLVFIEVPLEFDDDASGEYIVVQQSNDSLYVVDTIGCVAGVRMYRVPFSDGTNQLSILDSYEDDDFVREFIDRLEDMDTEDYDVEHCDAAETVARQLSRMLEHKASKTTLDDLFTTAGLFFGPIGFEKPAESFQAESRCSRVGCSGCGV